MVRLKHDSLIPSSLAAILAAKLRSAWDIYLKSKVIEILFERKIL